MTDLRPISAACVMAQFEALSAEDRLSQQDWEVLDHLLGHGAIRLSGISASAVVGLAGSDAHLERLVRAGLIMRLPGPRSATFLITNWGDLRWRQERQRLAVSSDRARDGSLATPWALRILRRSERDPVCLCQSLLFLFCS